MVELPESINTFPSAKFYLLSSSLSRLRSLLSPLVLLWCVIHRSIGSRRRILIEGSREGFDRLRTSGVAGGIKGSS